MHAIATMVADLRQQPGELGLVWANGGYVTKHSFGVYSTNPPDHGFRHADPQDEIDALPRRVLAAAGRRRRTGHGRGVHRDARPGRTPRAGDRRLPARRRAPGLGHVDRPRRTQRQRSPTANGSAAVSTSTTGARSTPAERTARHAIRLRRQRRDREIDAAMTERAVPIILDCDPGHDDAIAIVTAVHHAELVGVTTVAGNAPLASTTRNACVMRELIDGRRRSPTSRSTPARHVRSSRRSSPPGTCTVSQRARRRRPPRAVAGPRLHRRRRVHHRHVPEASRDLARRRRTAHQPGARPARRRPISSITSPGSR